MKVEISKQYKQKPGGTKSGSKLLELLQKDISLGSKKLNMHLRYQFYDKISLLVSSGIDLSTGLQIMIEEEKKNFLKDMYKTIHENLVKGGTLSESLKDTKQFSSYEYISIQIGEESGRLVEILSELATYYEMRDAQNRQLKGAMAYPLLVIVVAVGVVGFMLQVIVPMFASVYKRFGSDLPAITQTILNISNWLRSNILFVLLIILIVGVGFYLIRKNITFQKITDRIVLRIPFIGKLNIQLFHARLCHALALLSASQVPLVNALQMVSDMVSSYKLKSAVKRVQQGLLQGNSLYQGMKKEKHFDKKLTELTRIAEETNQIKEVYGKLYKQYSTEIKQQTEILGKLMEPLLIIVVGFFVMIILISMYLPLFQISTSFF